MFLHRGSGQRLSVNEAWTRTAGNCPEAVLLDVREEAEWRSGHAPGAVHAPLTALAAHAAIPVGARGRPLVVICRSGHRSQQAAKILAERGADAADAKGGMIAWAAAGLPVTDERGDGGSIA
ncbi:rhodanese-like domain-containing protein [Streptomyces sp. NRRL B-1381]|uniref:rhodanese-like domain-containing protein n=1 Tax=Streptomyces sp. NRRL B-1381 TaxID=1463829 RepID=UPI00099CFAF3|nr:rhodanese-like domain-containing protein [Streptomyces sp. NRRL B-1381]